MKINHKELESLYQSSIANRTGPSRKNCPSPEELLEALRSPSSSQKKDQIVDHLSQCSHCAREFQFILQSLRYERELKQKLSEMGSTPKKPFSFFSFSRFSWKYTSLVGAALLLIVVFGFLLFQNFKKQDYRGSSGPSIQLIHPVSQAISPPVTFRWEKTHKADYYILEIFDKTLYPFWKSKKIHSSRLVLPKDVTDRLENNKDYYWMVSSYLQDGRKVESRIQGFKVTR